MTISLIENKSKLLIGEYQTDTYTKTDLIFFEDVTYKAKKSEYDVKRDRVFLYIKEDK